MTRLLELREKIFHFYGKNEIFLKPVSKFVLALAGFLVINLNIGYMSVLGRMPVMLVLSAVCSVIPASGMMFLMALVTLAHMYALSMEVCLITLMLFSVIYFVYFRFSPRHSYSVLLTPICFKLHIPYIMPIGMGLLQDVYSVFSLICGIVAYFFLEGVQQNSAVLANTAEQETTSSKISVVLNQLMGNKEMYLVLGVMVITLLMVYMIRRMSIDHAWTVAVIAGTLFETIGLIAGYIMLDIRGKTAGVLLGSVVSCLGAIVIHFLFFNLDYSRTERLQFEDDEYYYYVKAVPKAIVAESDKKIKRFSGKEKQERLTKQQFAKELEIDEKLLD